jgi:N-acetyllactosaminide beta-1,3-N-acetylglucosaminyltransferase
MNLTYPVNLLRNVARQNAPTHYILASDAELYPSLDMVRLFFDMLRRNESVLHLGRPKVFVLPIFEVYRNQTVPSSKTELVIHLILIFSFYTKYFEFKF